MKSLPKILYVNSFEVSSSREVFCLTLKFESPDETIEKVYANMTPSGMKTLAKAISNEVQTYEEKYGEVATWKKPNKNTEENNKTYVS